MGMIASVTATLRQFHGKYVTTSMGGFVTSVNSSPLFRALIYDVLFLEDGSYGSYESQNIQGYLACLSIVTILCHVVGVVVFGFSTVEESDYKPSPDTEDARVANGNDSSLRESAERNAVMKNSITSGSRNDPVELTPKCSVIQILKSPRFTALVLGPLYYCVWNTLQLIIWIPCSHRFDCLSMKLCCRSWCLRLESSASHLRHLCRLNATRRSTYLVPLSGSRYASFVFLDINIQGR